METRGVQVVLFKSRSSGGDAAVPDATPSFLSVLEEHGYSVAQVDPLAFEFHLSDLVTHVEKGSFYSGEVFSEYQLRT
jgi:hypothetical protein